MDKTSKDQHENSKVVNSEAKEPEEKGQQEKEISDLPTMKQVVYSDTMSKYKAHVYHLHILERGRLRMKGPSSEQVSFELIRTGSKNSTLDGDHVEPGEYILSISGTRETAVPYQLTLSGVAMKADTILPKIKVSKPIQHKLTLEPNETSVHLEGSVTGARSAIVGKGEDIVSDISGVFSVHVPVDAGETTVKVEATDEAMNYPHEVFFVTK